ncbi:MAG: hypothetical protein KDA32_13565 [Phycisphaerales bacterium]|nr:hypothetical protein [Phycisphaerales bacterium]
MSTLTKVFVVLNSILSVVVSILFVSTAAQWANYKEIADTTRAQRDAIAVKLQNTVNTSEASLALKDEEIRNLTQQIGQHTTTLATRDAELAKLRTESAETRNRALAAEAGRERLENLLEVATAETANLRAGNGDLLTRVNDLQSRNTAQNARILDLTSELTIANENGRNLQEKLYSCEQGYRDLQTQFAGGAQVAQPVSAPLGTVSTSTPPSRRVTGRVISVDGAYATVDVGETSGVVEGMTFMVYRQGGEGASYLGDLVIKKVRPKESGGVLETLVRGDVRPGDSIVYEQGL